MGETGIARTTPNVYLYRGERFDTDLGLYYLRARWYNPVTGRFMTRDPYQGSIYDPTSLHRYNYARANPANFVDPSGRDSAAEYGAIVLDVLAEKTAVAQLGFTVQCAIFSIASEVHLVGQTLGQNLNQLSRNFKTCAASETVSDLATGWPSGWSADFELHAPFETTVEGHVENGKMTRLLVTQKIRAKDVVVVKNITRGSS